MKKIAVVLIALLVFFPFSFQLSVEAKKIDQDQERIQPKKDLVEPGTPVTSGLTNPRNPQPNPMFLPNVKPGEAKPKLIPIEPIKHIYRWLKK